MGKVIIFPGLFTETAAGPPPRQPVANPQDWKPIPRTRPARPLQPPAAPTHSICWACAKPKPRTTDLYCTRCHVTGAANPWMNCTVCGVARKRNRPGEKHFTCRTHTPEGAPHAS